MSARILEFPRRRQRNIIVWCDPDDEGFFVIRGSHGWLHGNIAQAFEDAKELACADSVAVVVRP
jgi:hypothetical protein